MQPIENIVMKETLVTFYLKHPSIMHYEQTYNAPVVLCNRSYKQGQGQP